MEINRVYKYGEVSSGKNVVQFGWQNAESLPENVDYVVAYHSRSKFASEEEAKASRQEGTNAATVTDYLKFFESLSGSDPVSFYDRWDGKEKELEGFWTSNHPLSDEKQYLFMLKLARLLVTGKKFVMYSRGFKLVKADETGDSPTEV